ncbi:PREDICTED: poly [ADP-ribose] polymerase 4-like, partial [Priapulus caudatus]|uniref:Poly [ADP-ribose] polymerase 4-like n=1 Tax=Priapulus caudatus TaxID=37621 RepID=A0ABM1F6R4_PRICU
VTSLISKACQPCLSSISIDWLQFDEDTPPVVQAPNQIRCLFNGSRLVVYGFVPNCTMAMLRARVGGREVSTVVSTSALATTRGLVLHQLTARAVIDDWECGSLHVDGVEHE